MIQHTDSRGFTLVEIMIVIAVMAILAAIAAPNFQTYMTQRRLNGAARQVMTDMMEARMRAATQNNQFRIFFLDNHRYQVLDDDNNNNLVTVGETSVTRDIQNEYPDVSLNATADPIFYPRGTAFGATVTITNSGGSKDVRVASTGRVRIIDTP
ncbi:MAG: GspH/FimT family pseudopilin [Syntrophales bacterium]|jgi:type IV fimbrial biogenesis protein FimT|nr:GspH/FimT family pseudopilin [Syntrophales bacterium]